MEIDENLENLLRIKQKVEFKSLLININILVMNNMYSLD